MASPRTRERIIKESYLSRYMNRTQVILVELTSISIAYKLVTDSPNFFAPSADIIKFYPGNRGNHFENFLT